MLLLFWCFYKPTMTTTKLPLMGWLKFLNCITLIYVYRLTGRKIPGYYCYYLDIICLMICFSLVCLLFVFWWVKTFWVDLSHWNHCLLLQTLWLVTAGLLGLMWCMHLLGGGIVFRFVDAMVALCVQVPAQHIQLPAATPPVPAAIPTITVSGCSCQAPRDTTQAPRDAT